MEYSVTEIKVPVPWGHIAVKTWGNPDDPPIFCFHGILDNAGAFDRLIALLPKTFYYIAVDLPGHGRSSHFPAHLPVYTTNYILAYKALKEYFKLEKFTIMGHSYGGQIGFMYSQMYPQHVERLVLLDAIIPITVPTSWFIDHLKDKLEMHCEIESKLASRQPPTYTYAEALNRVQFSRNWGTICEDAAKCLLNRAIEPVGGSDGKFRFTIDQRLKNIINPTVDLRYVVEAYKTSPVCCPTLIILSKQSVLNKNFGRLTKSFGKNVVFKLVDGNHDVHNDKPELVAPLVEKFLLCKRHKL
ncbi:unnamed protein product [Acanthoscelides obtectus]|uniref:AB hydrolase-1 domain-containing protein n=1 Tax=Acanthoscelides obtectus TaxID=200917 RepID=A0A9P0KDX2_ACAOB|nr:unnamed protein product [Acanthoscelides obtectus]CAK1676440.1 Serine hydrolase-like protein 2 [Acanthoscelides obtectus]